jgi:hypothetical protein
MIEMILCLCAQSKLIQACRGKWRSLNESFNHDQEANYYTVFFPVFLAILGL